MLKKLETLLKITTKQTLKYRLTIVLEKNSEK